MARTNDPLRAVRRAVPQPIRSGVRRHLPPVEYWLHGLTRHQPSSALRMRTYQRFGVQLESPSTTAIMRGTEVWAPTGLSIGADTVIGRWCLLDARGGITIGRHVNISSYTKMMTAKHDIDDPGFAAVYAPIVIGDRVWVALGATIIDGVTIGEGAVVCAGAVVTRDVPPFTVVGGVPARHIRDRPREQTYRIDYRPDWL